MTQAEAVIDYMREHGSITSEQAIRELGITRLAAVIVQLKRRGYAIEKVTGHVKTRYKSRCAIARYRLLGRWHYEKTEK